MGQNLQAMKQQQSANKSELLYELVASTANVDAVKALVRQGASLEWIGMDGRTPLIVACTRRGVIDVTKTLIQLGAKLNAYCPGRLGGTPLHHAAREGLEETVMLLLTHGANALVMNDDCQTPLDVARINGHSAVVRLIENHICYFSGWVRQIYSPGFLGAVVPHLLTKKIWAVVIPRGPNNAAKPLKLELAVYSTSQDSQPSMVIHLWKAQIEQPNLSQLDPSIVIFDDSTKTRLKLASGVQGDKRQLLSLCDACRGISQIGLLPAHGSTQTSVPSNDSNPVDTSPAPNSHQTPESLNTNSWEVSSNNETYNGWGSTSSSNQASESLKTSWETPSNNESNNNWGSTVAAAHPEPSESLKTNGWETPSNNESNNGWGSTVAAAHPEPTTGQWAVNPVNEDFNSWNVPENRTRKNPNKNAQKHHYEISSVPPTNNLSVSVAPSAPPIGEDMLAEGPICYPSIDLGPDIATQLIDNTPSTSNAVDGGLCAICWEAPTQGACVPCGHMAGCITCLTVIKDKGGGCPVCRSKIDQIVRLYTV